MSKLIKVGDRSLFDITDTEIFDLSVGALKGIERLRVTTACLLELSEDHIIIHVVAIENEKYHWDYVFKIFNKIYSIFEEMGDFGSRDFSKNITNLESINFFLSRGFAVELQGVS